MNIGTKIRTILVIVTSLNTALLATDLTGFNIAALDMAYKIASVVLNFIIVACATYYNNDYTEEACQGTGYARWLKAVRKGETFGDGLQDEPEIDEDAEDILISDPSDPEREEVSGDE